MKYGTFLQKLEKGLITDLKPFLTDGTAAFREEIARRGLYIEELVAKNEPTVLVSLIRHGHAQQYYDEWKTYPDKRVREELARTGHYPEELIKDSDSDVRAAVIRANPEKMRMGLGKSDAEWAAAKRIVITNPNVTVADIDDFLAAPIPTYEQKWHPQTLPAYQEKRNCILHPEATILEKTLSPYDLYKMGNALWVTGLTIQQIITMYDMRSILEHAGIPIAFDHLFDQLIATSQDIWKARNVVKEAYPGIPMRV